MALIFVSLPCEPFIEERHMAQNVLPLGELPTTGYVRQSQLILGILPFSSATLWRMVKAGTFPRPVKLSPRVSAWKIEAVRSWMQARDAAEPAPVKRQRKAQTIAPASQGE
jgi:prophage regulatory protein